MILFFFWFVKAYVGALNIASFLGGGIAIAMLKTET